MRDIKILKWLAIGAVAFSLLFSGIALIVYFFTAWPETSALRFAQNENYPIHTATFTEYRRTTIMVNNEIMYRLYFEWDGNRDRTRAVYNLREAEARIGQPVQIRASEDRAVLLNFERTALSIVGFVILGVFGGIAFIALVIAGVLGLVYKKKAEERN